MEMNDGEEDDGDGEERVPRSPTVASSMGCPDGRKGPKDMFKRQGGRGDEKKKRRLGEIKE